MYKKLRPYVNSILADGFTRGAGHYVEETLYHAKRLVNTFQRIPAHKAPPETDNR